jgi:outer membrane protein assembly factor BamA
VQSLPHAAAIAETSSTVVPMDLLARDGRWEQPSLAVASEMERFRYRGDYSLDFAQSAVSTSPVFGTSAGAFIALSDILGNDQYYFLVYNNAEAQDEILSSFNVAISRLSLSKRTGYAYGIYRFAGRQYDLTSEDVYYYEKVYGGYLSLNYPLSKFERLETTVSLSNSLRDNYSLIQRRALLLSNSVSFVHDNSLWGPTGPLDGRRFSLTLAYTSDIQYSNVNYFSIIADYRQYLRISLRSAFASRFWLFYNDGKESRRFVMGGSWDLRGWPRWSIRGEKLWLVSNELRFPLLDELGLRFPFGGISFGAFRGALFADVGGAWDDFRHGTYGSVGGGLRLNLFGALVLRYDIGKTIVQDLTRFQRGLFYQFFFGWDF